jgi:perosamine synthetase
MTSENISLPIPMSSPDLSEIERQAVMSVVYTPILSMGAHTSAFEQAFRDYLGCKYAIAVNSGTAGLHLCIRAAGVCENDLVITTPFSFVASTNVILFERAVPVFVDVDPATGNINTSMLEQVVHDLETGGKDAQQWLPRRGQGISIRSSLKAILPVDVFGQPADLDPICKVAKEHKLKVIEDSCEALGGEYKGRKAGTIGDYGVFGFYPNKQITTGEGGMIVTDDEKAAQLMSALRNQGRAPGDTWLQHTHLGYNYRIDEMSAALGATQMRRIEALIARRAQVAQWYVERLSELPYLRMPQIASTTTRMSWFVFVIWLNREIDREKLAEKLNRFGIPVRPYFLPIHMQPYMVERFGYQAGDFPVTEALGQCGLALPFSGTLDEAQVDYVCRKLALSV